MIAAQQLLEHDGIRAGRLYRCDSEMWDGTSLDGLVKTRLPWPDGPWGAVLELRKADRLYLQVLAVGERHPRGQWRPSVYQLAHQRLHSPTER